MPKSRSRAVQAPRYKAFPPGKANVLVPVRPARVAALGTTLYTASKRRPLAAQLGLWGLARIGGVRLIPGQPAAWNNPVPTATWRELLTHWHGALGQPVVAMAVYNRPQKARTGLTLMIAGRSESMVVRLRTTRAELVREIEISRAAQILNPTQFRVPRLIGADSVDGWHWSAFETIGSTPHRPARSVGPELTAEISELVGSVVPRKPTEPAHWIASHGDLTPWNVRLTSWYRPGGTPARPWLIDWEDAGWSPPGADQLLFLATSKELSHRGPIDLSALTQFREAAAFHAKLVRSRPDETPEWTARILAAFDGLA